MSPSDKELNLINQLKDTIYFKSRKKNSELGDMFVDFDNELYTPWKLVVQYGTLRIIPNFVWFPNSDDLHELIRKLGYEFGNVVEREPSGTMKIQFINYKASKDRKAYSNPFTHVAECAGKTMREALLSGLLKIIQEGVY